MKNHSIQAFELLTQRKCGRKFSSFEHPPQKKKEKNSVGLCAYACVCISFLNSLLVPI